MGLFYRLFSAFGALYAWIDACGHTQELADANIPNLREIASSQAILS